MPLQPAARPRSSRRREPGLLVLCILLLLLATVPPLINLGRFQRRIAGAISQSVSRPVRMGSVSLRMLPWPALQISSFQVDEEPGFGAEPALFAPEVLAELRLSSLWRGRFELSRVTLSDASVNLVRLPTGRWNISSVLLSASHVRNAPTGQSRPGPAPRFPYIQATGTRINFKRGVEKLPYSILNADFSMVLVRPEVWQLQLEGQPVRTDLELTSGDTGTVQLEGEVHRASALGTMPLALHAAWKHGALGQLSRLLLGRDAGWRGDVDATAQLNGEMDHLQITTHVVLGNLHRQEFAPEQPFTLDATCRGNYSHSAGALGPFSCRLPLGSGDALLSRGLAADTDTLTLAVEKVPASIFVSIFALLGHEGAPARSFGGNVEGAFRYTRAAGAQTGMLAGALTSVSVTVAGGKPDGSPLAITGLMLRPSAGGKLPLLLSADPVPLGSRDRRLLLSAEFFGDGYAAHANGSGSLDAVQAAAGSLHLPALRSLSNQEGDQPEAAVELSLTHAGSWNASGASEPPTPNLAGSVDFEHVRWKVPLMPIVVDFPELHAALSPGLAAWTTSDATLGYGDGRMELAGDAQAPLGCVSDGSCTMHFNVRTASLDTAAIQALFHSPSRPLVPAWFNRFDPSQARVPALTGTVRAGVLMLGRLPVHDALLRVSTVSQASSGTSFGNETEPAIRLESLDGHALGGKLHVEGALRLPGDSAHYAVHASLTGASAVQAAALWHENWGPGTLGGEAELQLSGDSIEQLTASARGSFHVSWLHGSLPVLPRFTSWDASGTLGSDGLHIEQGTEKDTLSSPPARLDGRIGWDRSLQLHLAPNLDPKNGDRPATITGTLADPLLTPAAATDSPAQ